MTRLLTDMAVSRYTGTNNHTTHITEGDPVAKALTTSEVAERLGISGESVRRYIRDGQLVAQETAGGQFRITEEALAAHLRRIAGVRGPRVIAIANQKGGVGKTTTTVNLGTELAARGERVLLIDMDPQAHTTRHLGLVPYEQTVTVWDVLQHPRQGAARAIQTLAPNLDLIPARLELSKAERDLNSVFDRDRLLAAALAPILDQYSIVLIDCPPSLGTLTFNAFMAATEVMVPMQVEPFAVLGIGQLQEAIEAVQLGNPALHISGVICTMYDGRNSLHPAIAEQIRGDLPTLVFDTVVPRNVALAEATGAGLSIQAYDSASRGASAYAALAQEVMTRG